MDTASRIDALREYAEGQAEIVNEHLCNAFTQLCREVVADWHKRYPRHRFRIWEGHGMMSADISPPLGWHKSREWEAIEYCRVEPRGAIGTLVREAKALQDAFDNLDERIQFTINGELVSPS